jgi:ectoine hydroxylase-related dioxygenase (phytanoyl-CoA dioxygenase family)
MVWRFTFWEKNRETPQFPWHRDSIFWRDQLKPMINVSVWLALERATPQNGCVKVIPGSSSMTFEEKRLEVDGVLPNHAPRRFIDVPQSEADRAVDMELEPGEFFMFDKDLVHRSCENPTGTRRLALAMRFTVPSVVCDHDAIVEDHACIMVAGEDKWNLNRMVTAPEPYSPPR